jgi:glycosyltransferase involved in cell wall biosynthesis
LINWEEEGKMRDTRRTVPVAPDWVRKAAVKFSVVVPCFNGGDSLEYQIEALLTQTYSGPYEVLVVDNRSTDATADIINRHAAQSPIVRYVAAHARQGINHARNRGVEESSGDFILFCDADDVVHGDWLERHAEAAQAGAMLVAGTLAKVTVGQAVLVVANNTGLWAMPSPAGANCGVSRAVFERVGFFDESYVGGGDETDFFWRAQLMGYFLCDVPGARVDYTTRPGLRSFMNQQFAYGKSHPKLYRDFRAYGMPRSNPFRSLLSIGKAAVELLTARNGTERQKAGAGKLALHWGRAVGSLGSRVLYL